MNMVKSLRFDVAKSFLFCVMMAFCFIFSQSGVALETIVIDIPNLPEGAKPLEMIRIPAGTFTMGSPDNEIGRENNEGPQHSVEITNDFYMGKYEVTQAQWKTLMNQNVPETSHGIGDNLPVYRVSWNQSQEFIAKLNDLGLGEFRLPKEAEWEYACRAGTTTRYYWGDDLDYTMIDDYCWYTTGLHDVGLKLPNEFGIYDMLGNIAEWCQDRFRVYTEQAQVDPANFNTQNDLLYKGGNGFSNADECRSAIRHTYYGHQPEVGYVHFGFRIAADKILNDSIPTPTSTPIPALIPTPTQTPTPVSAGTEPFELPLNVDIGPSTFNLNLGTNESATVIYDPGIDVLSPPADPSGREAYFILVSGEKLWTDLRNPDTENRKWTLIITVPPNQEATIAWNPELIPDDGYFVPVDAMGRPSGKSIDMKTEDSIDIEAQGGFVARKFYYLINFETILPVTLEYDLISGWNLISVPLRVEEDVVPSSVFGAITPIWSYNPEISQYETPTSFEMQKGYWVYVEHDQIFQITGRQENNLPITLIPTWNLIGVNQEVLRSTEGIGVVWGYDNVKKRYIPVAPTEYLEPQKAYWFQVGEPIELFSDTPPAKVSHRVNKVKPLNVETPSILYLINPSIGSAPLATLELGRDASAINELGTEDLLAPPPVPDSDGNAFFLLNTGVDYVKVMRDVRSMQGNLTWLLEIDQNPGIPASLTWDTAVFEGLSQAEIIEIDPNTLQPIAGSSSIKMAVTNSLQLAAPQGFGGTSRFFQITLSENTAVYDWFIMN